MSDKGIKAFHAHLDECVQCQQHPFALCVTGATLLEAGGGTIGSDSKDLPLNDYISDLSVPTMIGNIPLFIAFRKEG